MYSLSISLVLDVRRSPPLAAAARGRADLHGWACKGLKELGGKADRSGLL